MMSEETIAGKALEDWGDALGVPSDRREDLSRLLTVVRKECLALACDPDTVDEQRYLEAIHNARIQSASAEESDANVLATIRTIIRNTETRVRKECEETIEGLHDHLRNAELRSCPTCRWLCEQCGDEILLKDIDGIQGHARATADSEGGPMQVHCGPVSRHSCPEKACKGGGIPRDLATALEWAEYSEKREAKTDDTDSDEEDLTVYLRGYRDGRKKAADNIRTGARKKYAPEKADDG